MSETLPKKSFRSKLPMLAKTLIVPTVVGITTAYFHYRLEATKATVETTRHATEASYETIAPAIKELQENVSKLSVQVTFYEQILKLLLDTRINPTAQERLEHAAMLTPGSGASRVRAANTVRHLDPIPVPVPKAEEPQRLQAKTLLDHAQFKPLMQQRQVPVMFDEVLRSRVSK